MWSFFKLKKKIGHSLFLLSFSINTKVNIKNDTE